MDSNQQLIIHLRKRNLSENGSWDDVNTYDSNQQLIIHLRKRNLPVNGSWSDVNAYDSK